jgi:hypothetical protein
MNEKWFAYAISLTILMIFTNAFITIGASQPNADGTYNVYLLNSMNSKLDYGQVKSDSNLSFEACSLDSSQPSTTEQGCQPFKRNDGSPASFNAFDSLTLMTVGIEVVMLNLAAIFSPVAPLFWAVAAVAFFIKIVAMAWLTSIVLRQILTGRLF